MSYSVPMIMACWWREWGCLGGCTVCPPYAILFRSSGHHWQFCSLNSLLNWIFRFIESHHLSPVSPVWRQNKWLCFRIFAIFVSPQERGKEAVVLMWYRNNFMCDIPPRNGSMMFYIFIWLQWYELSLSQNIMISWRRNPGISLCHSLRISHINFPSIFWVDFD